MTFRPNSVENNIDLSLEIDHPQYSSSNVPSVPSFMSTLTPEQVQSMFVGMLQHFQQNPAMIPGTHIPI
jgi:hypothetical protein